MNRLSTERRAQVLGCLVEGMSIRATVRATGAAKNTVVNLLADAGSACAAYQDAAFRNLTPSRIEVDEIWAYCYAKQKNVPDEHQGTFGYGDVWTWTAIDSESKLVPSWLVGERTSPDCYAFLTDLRSRLVPGHRFQLTSDGFNIYPPIVDALWRGNIDYAQIVKEYGGLSEIEQRRYSPAECTGISKRKVSGDPDEAYVSTSYVERQNLTMRMGMRRYTRLTNGFSKKVENLAHAVSLHFAHYNLCRPHQTLTKQFGTKTTPAMAAGVEDYPWSLTQLAELLETSN
ncbi:MAG: IS1 family transposase [Acidimicrobiia bacterium]